VEYQRKEITDELPHNQPNAADAYKTHAPLIWSVDVDKKKGKVNLQPPSFLPLNNPFQRTPLLN